MTSKVKAAGILLLSIPVIFSVLNFESFILLRYAAIVSGLMTVIWVILNNKKKVYLSTPFLAFAGLFLLVNFLHFLFSKNPYNIRMYFTEFSVYIFIALYFSSGEIKENFDEMFSVGIITASMLQGVYSVPQLIAGASRIEGNSNYPNFLSMLFSAGILSSIFMIRKYWKKPLSVVYALFAAAAVFLAFRTGSRNVAVLLPAAIFILFFFLDRKKAVIISAAAIILLLIIPNPVRNRLIFESASNPVSVQRPKIYRQCIGIFLKNPLIGIGYNNLEKYSMKTNFPVEGRVGRYAAHAEIAHNEYIEWCVNNGIFGIAMWVIIFIMFLKSLYEAEKGRQLFTGIVFVYLCASVFDNSLYMPFNASIFFIAVGVSAQKSHRIEFSKVLKYAVVILALFVTASAAVDIAAAADTRNMQNEFKNASSLKEYEKIEKRLERDFLMTVNPEFLRSGLAVAEKMFLLDNGVDRFYGMLDAYTVLGKIDEYNYMNHVSYARFLQRYKMSVLRRNENIDSLICAEYENAVALNPHNPFLRTEYARYLLIEGDTAQAEEQLKTAVKDEPNFLKGYRLYVEITGAEKSNFYINEIKRINDSISALRKNAKTEYERMLLD